MKLSILSITTVCMGIAVYLISSSFKDEVKYSCDPKIDNWVKENKENLQKVSLDQLNKYPKEKIIPIYRALTPSKRESLWVEKFDKIINSPSEWNGEEIKHIIELKNYLVSSKFFYKDKADMNYLYFESWSELGIKKFNWSKADIGFLTMTFLTSTEERIELAIHYEKEMENNKKLEMEKQSKLVSSFSETACTCRTTSECQTNYYCVPGGCIVTSGGCGWFGSQNCTGRCIP